MVNITVFVKHNQINYVLNPKTILLLIENKLFILTIFFKEYCRTFRN